MIGAGLRVVAVGLILVCVIPMIPVVVVAGFLWHVGDALDDVSLYWRRSK